MKAYLDSSFLFSLYAHDDHSSRAVSEFANVKGTTVLTSLCELEVLNAFELRVFRKELTRTEADQIKAAFEADIVTGVFDVIEIEPATFVRANSLVSRYTAIAGARTADILHVAAAVETGADKFLTFDERQKALAQRAKLKTN